MQETRRGARTTALVRPAAVLALVFGILAMHAMSDSARPDAGSARGVAQAAHSAGVIGHHVEQLRGDDHTAGVADPRGGADAEGGGHAMAEMVMLCGAMLAGAASLLVLLTRLRRVPRPWAVLRVGSVSSRTVRWRSPTGAGPPAVWRFSVIRC